MKRKLLISIIVFALLLSAFTPILMMLTQFLRDGDKFENVHSITVNLETIIGGNTEKKQYKTDKNTIYDFLVQTTLFTFIKDENDNDIIETANGKNKEETTEKKFYVYKNGIEVKDKLIGIPVFENDTIKVIDELEKIN